MIDKLFQILDAAEELFSEDAVFVKKDGRRIENVSICSESESSEQFAGKYPMGVNDVFFSMNEKALAIDGGVLLPEAGDVIETENARYKIVKDPQTGKAWQWRWSRPGERFVVRAQEIKQEKKDDNK